MKSKKSVLLTSAAICLLAAPIAMGARRGHSSASFSAPRANFSASRPSFTASRANFSDSRPSFTAPRANFSAARSSFTAPRSGFAAPRTNLARQARPQFSQRSGAVSSNWHGSGNHHGNHCDNRHHRHHRHHHHRSHNFFFADFGFPYYGYGWGYPYNGYGYYPYNGEYYSYDEGAQVYEGHLDASLVLQVQRRLARAGYYHGAIDGVVGVGTRRAIRAYERSHRLPVNGVIDGDLLATMGLS